MAINLGNALGAITQVQTGRAQNYGEKPLIEFIEKINKYGVQLRARYEVNFSGIEDITFFVTDITTPNLRQNFGNIYFEGKSVEIPVNIEYDHDVSLTIINDGSGILYTTIVNWMLNQDAGESVVNSGYTMTIRSLGDGVSQTGMTIVLEGVRMRNISGLNYNSADASVSTFTLTLSVISFKAILGDLQEIGGYAGALGSLFK